MKVLVTGVTGFLGSYLAEHLLRTGDRVMGLSRRGCWHEPVSPQVRRQVDLFSWDVKQPIRPDLRDEVARFSPDWIVHLAAISTPGACGSDRPNQLALQTNVAGTRGLLELVATLPAANKRLLFVSSCHVYAPRTATDPLVDEDAQLGPTGGYGMTKLRAEQEVRSAAERHGMEIVIARGFQHTGPRQAPRYMLSEWAAQLSRHDDKPLRVKCLRSLLDLSDVRDVVRAYRLLLDFGRPGDVYNIGSGIARMSGQVLTELQDIHRQLEPSAAKRAIVELTHQQQINPIACIQKVQNDTGWAPEIPWNKTLVDTLQFWLHRREHMVDREKRTAS